MFTVHVSEIVPFSFPTAFASFSLRILMLFGFTVSMRLQQVLFLYELGLSPSTGIYRLPRLLACYCSQSR